MVGIPNPREGTKSADCDRNVSHNAHGKNSVMLNVERTKRVNDFQKQPQNSRESASRVYATQVLINVM